jgi:hypothetical protein
MSIIEGNTKDFILVLTKLKGNGWPKIIFKIHNKLIWVAIIYI